MSKVEMNGDIANNVGHVKIGEKIVKCSSNILLRKGVLNKKTHKVIENESVIIYGNKEEYLYHIVTEQGYFYLGDELVVDYNGMMDNYLK